MPTQQGLRHAGYRLISGTAGTHDGDMVAAAQAETGQTYTSYVGAMIDWLQHRTGSTDGNLNNLMALWASWQGADNFGAVGDFEPNGDSLSCWYQAGHPKNTVTAGAVERFFDLSGNGNHADPPSTGRRPADTTYNGLAVARFDGVDDYANILTPPSFAGGITFGMVFRVITKVNFKGLLSASTTAGTDHQTFFAWQQELAADSDLQLFVNSTATNPGLIGNVTNPDTVMYAIGTLDGTSLELRTSSDGTATDTMTDPGWSGAPDKFVIGARWNASAAFSYSNMDLLELAIWSRPLTAAQKSQLETYFTNRYGL